MRSLPSNSSILSLLLKDAVNILIGNPRYVVLQDISVMVAVSPSLLAGGGDVTISRQPTNYRVGSRNTFETVNPTLTTYSTGVDSSINVITGVAGTVVNLDKESHST